MKVHAALRGAGGLCAGFSTPTLRRATLLIAIDKLEEVLKEYVTKNKHGSAPPHPKILQKLAELEAAKANA